MPVLSRAVLVVLLVEAGVSAGVEIVVGNCGGWVLQFIITLVLYPFFLGNEDSENASRYESKSC